MLISLQLARLDKCLALFGDALYKNVRWLVVRILRNELAAHREVKDGRL